MFGTLSRIRNPEDLYSVQLTSSYFASFIKTFDPNPDLEYLQVRGYDRVVDAVKKSGTWGEVKKNDKQLRLLDYPSKKGSFVDVDQCKWLGYGVDYYIRGGK